jgi:hypothetical protein
MSATKADTGAREIMEKFLQFLIQHMSNNDPSDCLNKLIETKNKSNDTLFTLLMRNGHEDFGKSREKLFELMEKHSNRQGNLLMGIHIWSGETYQGLKSKESLSRQLCYIRF